MALHRLWTQGAIRRVLRGIYDYPRYSLLLGEPLSPDIDRVAQALARKLGWRILPNGPSALNLMGLSTQVPAQYLYLSDGPDRSYRVGATDLVFKRTALKEAAFNLPESRTIVQGLKSIGQDTISAEVIAGIRDWLPPALRPKVLADTRTATGWVYEAIRQICREGDAPADASAHTTDRTKRIRGHENDGPDCQPEGQPTPGTIPRDRSA